MFYQARDREIAPRGPRPEGPPLLVGAFGPRMLCLAARHADLWNTAYLTQPETLVKPQALWYPDLLPEQPQFEDGVLSGAPEVIAAAMRGFAEMGVAHLIFHTVPNNSAAVAHLAAALELYRREGPAGG